MSHPVTELKSKFESSSTCLISFLFLHLEDGVRAPGHDGAELRRVGVLPLGPLPLRPPSLRYRVADQRVQDRVQDEDESPVVRKMWRVIFSVK